MNETIGYVPISRDLSHPADRRRLVFWAKARGKNLELRDLTSCDKIVFSENSNFDQIRKFDSKIKILDLVDAYLTPENCLQDLTRGFLKHGTGNQSGWIKPFSWDVKNACKNVDAIICSSVEQAKVIRKYNSEVHVILDSHDEFADLPFDYDKLEISTDLEYRLFWEGQAATLGNFKGINSVLLKVLQKNPFNLELVTDEEYFLVMNQFFRKPISHAIKNLEPGIKKVVTFHKWSVDEVKNVATKSNLALLPVNTRSNFQRLKPENRLHIMWRLGLPCLTSKIPSYSRVANLVQQSFTCESRMEWENKINSFMREPNLGREQVEAGKQYLSSFHSTEQLLSKWDRVLGYE